MNLTEDLTRAVAEHPDIPIRFTDPVTKREYVLLSAATYDRLRAAYDDSPWTEEERDALRAESLESLGWEGMEAYQDDGP